MNGESSDIIYDVVIIGAGVIGNAAARVLSRYDMTCLVAEKEADVSFGVSKANSGIIHAGFHHSPDTLKATLECRGNAMFDQLNEELQFPFIRCGIIVAAFSTEEMRIIEDLYQRGRSNRVPGIELCGRDRIHSLEPKLNPDIIGGLYAPSGGIIEPYRFAFALKESACKNGVEYACNFEVVRSAKREGIFHLESRDGQKLRCRYVINAAGLYADEVSAILGAETFTITPRKGEEYLLDRKAACHTSAVIFPVPGTHTKGMLVIPTAEETTMTGPTAEVIMDKEDASTSSRNFNLIFGSARRLVPSCSEKDLITSFAGLRPVLKGDDFYIAVSEKMPGVIQAAGIQSPGLTASPAIGEYIKDLLKQAGMTLTEKTDYDPLREDISRLRDCTLSEIDALIEKDPAYGEIVCRCENVSEAEIVSAIRRGHTTADGIKFYTRAGMGRCQGGFCSYKIIKILSRETGQDISQLTKRGGGSSLVYNTMGKQYEEG